MVLLSYLKINNDKLFPPKNLRSISCFIKWISKSAFNSVSLGCYDDYWILAMCCILPTTFEIISILSLFYTSRSQDFEIKI